MSKKTVLRQFWIDQNGGESVEWALLISLLIVGLFLLLTAINPRVQGLLNNIIAEFS
ncbi:hypothetical protein [Thiocystis violacea]|uniref:hypothetical protein n=1 Tax=Thiocystis violacea TaxID=13725 RepID=UPI001905C34B|nr:hypothetical protein [Thiocystis violacea]